MVSIGVCVLMCFGGRGMCLVFVSWNLCDVVVGIVVSNVCVYGCVGVFSMLCVGFCLMIWFVCIMSMWLVRLVMIVRLWLISRIVLLVFWCVCSSDRIWCCMVMFSVVVGLLVISSDVLFVIVVLISMCCCKLFDN